jgi:NADH-quinone oxidoreductase subunit C
MSETPTASQPLLGKAAVLEAMPDHPAVKAIVAWNVDALLDARFDFDELTLTVPPDQIRDACRTMKAAGYNFFEDMTAVDWLPASPRFQLSYHLLSHRFKARIRLKTMLQDASPAIESSTPVWPAADYYEREVFDLFGIRFEEHPNLRRIMMPDEWVGHPLRKDYPVEGYR